MARRASLADISARTGVSRTTVSLVLNGKAAAHRISPRTCERVRAAAAAADYVPDHAARTLRTGRSAVLGLVLPDLSNHFDAMLAKSLDRIAAAAGYQVLCSDCEDDPERIASLVQGMAERGVDGLVLVGSPDGGPPPAVELPLVLLDRRPRPLQAWQGDWVGSDNSIATCSLIGELVRSGRFAAPALFIGGPPRCSTNAERRLGLRRAWRAAGLDPQQLLLRERDWSPAWGAAALQETLAAEKTAWSVFCASATLLEGALGRLRDLPHGVLHCLACFDDHPLLDHLVVPVHSLRQDHAGLAQAAFDALTHRIDHPTTPPVNRVLPAGLHLRIDHQESTP